MKRFACLSTLLLSACSLFVIPAENQCAEGAPELSCDGNVLVLCDPENNFQIREDCGAEQTCNPNTNRCELNASGRCGDGVTQPPEECDDANTQNGDSCEGNCQAPSCGDGVLNAGNNEECDDANTDDTDACGDDCLINIPAGCGNGVIDPNEDCDTSLAAPCDADCSSPRCGNGITSVDENDQDEACDDGNLTNGDGCSDACIFEEELPSFCGNGTVDSEEGCDEGALNNNGVACNANCSIPACGDSFLNPTEACDDDNTDNGDGCDEDCQFENQSVDICGDGIVQLTEECDDGNLFNADECQASCQLPRCGDGVFDEGEVCFVPPPLVSPGTNGASSPRIGDFNNDGVLDLAFASFNSNNASVFFGNNDGSFDAPVVLTAGLNPIESATADLNGDGFDDLIVSNHNGDNVFVYLSNGDKTFQSPSTLTGFDNPQGIEAVDLDDDGDIDLAISNRFGNNVIVRLGDGTGAFGGALPTPSVGTESRELKATDFNNDGILDLVTTANISGTASVLRGIGDGTFASAFSDILGGTGFNVQGCAVGDINEDGLQDFAITRITNADVFVYLNTGNFTFQKFGPFAFQGGSGGTGIEMADINEDGQLEVVVQGVDAAIAGRTMVLSFNAGSFTPSIFAFGDTTNGLLIRDFNRDGHLDLAVGQFSNGQPAGHIAFGFGFGDGTFTSKRDLPATPANSQSMNINSGDLNGDGLSDLVVGAFFGGSYAIYLNNNGVFGNPTLLTTGIEPRATALADLDLDGDLDIVSMSTGENTSVLHFNNGSGVFGAPVVTNLGVGGLPKSVTVADMNHDGRPDLLYGRDFSVGILQGNGNGTFQAVVNIPAAGQISSIFVTDINRDGDPDLVSSAFIDQRMSILRGNGNLTFQTEITLTTSFRPDIASVADFNGDGDLDIAVGIQARSFFNFFSGNGDGTFGARQEIEVGFASTGASRAADINQDGLLDLVMLDSTSATVGVLLGLGDGSFQPAASLPVGGDSLSLTIEDFDQDGRLDIATTSTNNTTSLVYGFLR